MSALARTALRLAGIEALLADPVIAALCGTRVYDSRIAEFNEEEPVPVIVVLTEEMEGEAFDPANGGAPFDDCVDLILDIALRAIMPPNGEDGATPAIGTPETDWDLEATLDLLEHRAVDALTIGDTDQAHLVRTVARRFSKRKSQRFVDDDTGIKLALRQVTLSAELKGEDQGNAAELAEPVIAASAGGHNTGNGVLTPATPGFDHLVLKGNYTVTFTSPTAFTVTDPIGYAVGRGVCGAPFARQIRFTIDVGATPFAAADSFTVSVSQGPYAMLPEPLRRVCKAMPDGSSGAQTCELLAGAYGAPAPIALFTGVDMTVAPTLQLEADLAPIAPGKPGSTPAFEFNDTIPSSSGS